MTGYTEKVENLINRINKDMTTFENFSIVFGGTTQEQKEMYKGLCMVRRCLAMSTNKLHFNKLFIEESGSAGITAMTVYFARSYCSNNGFEILNIEKL